MTSCYLVHNVRVGQQLLEVHGFLDERPSTVQLCTCTLSSPKPMNSASYSAISLLHLPDDIFTLVACRLDDMTLKRASQTRGLWTRLHKILSSQTFWYKRTECLVGRYLEARTGDWKLSYYTLSLLVESSNVFVDLFKLADDALSLEVLLQCDVLPENAATILSSAVDNKRADCLATLLASRTYTDTVLWHASYRTVVHQWFLGLDILLPYLGEKVARIVSAEMTRIDAGSLVRAIELDRKQSIYKVLRSCNIQISMSLLTDSEFLDIVLQFDLDRYLGFKLACELIDKDAASIELDAVVRSFLVQDLTRLQCAKKSGYSEFEMLDSKSTLRDFIALTSNKQAEYRERAILLYCCRYGISACKVC